MRGASKHIAAPLALAGLVFTVSGAAAESEYWSIDDFPSDQAPSFEDYPTRPPVPYELFSVDLQSHPDAPDFAAALEAAIGRAPDFAAYHVVVQIGCGSGCVTVAAVNVDTGKVFVGPVAEHGVEYEAGSALLIVNPPAELRVGFTGGDDLQSEIPMTIFPKYYQLTDNGFEPVWCWRPDGNGGGDTEC